jgi:hypothetical protein
VAASSSLGGELALAAKSVPGRNENLRKIVTLRSQRVNEKQPQAVVEICHCGKIDIAGQKAEALQPLEESNAGVKLCFQTPPCSVTSSESSLILRPLGQG